MHVRIKVKPNSRENKIMRLPEGGVQVNIKAPPQDGKANAELIAFLAAVLKIPKSGIIIAAGESSRFKKVWLPADEAKIKEVFGEYF